MVKVSGPLFSLAFGLPLRKKRTPYAAAAATPPEPPIVEHCYVTAGDPAPDPDCTGTYDRIEDIEGKPAYQKLGDPTFYIFFSTYTFSWHIGDTQNSETANASWIDYDADPNSTYAPDTGSDGIPIVSGIPT